jgi:hypothetical protein
MYLYAEKLRNLCNPDTWNAIIDASQKFGTPQGIVFQVEMTRLQPRVNNLIGSMLRAHPSLAAPAPPLQERIAEARRLAERDSRTDEEIELDEFFDSNPWLDTMANRAALQSARANSPLPLEQLAKVKGLAMSTEWRNAISNALQSEGHSVNDANIGLLLSSIPYGAQPTAKVLAAAIDNRSRQLILDPREAWRRKEAAERAALEKEWEEKVSKRVRPDSSWSLETLREQLRLRLASISSIKKDVRGERPALREPKLPPDYCFPPGVWTTGGISDGIRRFPLDAETLKHVLRKEDTVARKLLLMFGADQINERMGVQKPKQVGEQTGFTGI